MKRPARDSGVFAAIFSLVTCSFGSLWALPRRSDGLALETARMLAVAARSLATTAGAAVLS